MWLSPLRSRYILAPQKPEVSAPPTYSPFQASRRHSLRTGKTTTLKNRSRQHAALWTVVSLLLSGSVWGLSRLTSQLCGCTSGVNPAFPLVCACQNPIPAATILQKTLVSERQLKSTDWPFLLHESPGGRVEKAGGPHSAPGIEGPHTCYIHRRRGVKFLVGMIKSKTSLYTFKYGGRERCIFVGVIYERDVWCYWLWYPPGFLLRVRGTLLQWIWIYQLGQFWKANLVP